MKTYINLLVGFLCCFVCVIHAGLQANLSDIKDKAEHGEAVAQEQLAAAYAETLDMTNAVIWYEKAAEQGRVNSQYKLGQILSQSAASVATKNNSRNTEQAIYWFCKASSQGHRRAQIELGLLYQNGIAVPADITEAYKWFGLAGKASKVPWPEIPEARGYQNALVLKMSREQIAEGAKRMETYTLGENNVESLPEPEYVNQIILKGISVTTEKSLAIINNKTVEVGESVDIRVENRIVKVQCLEVGCNHVLLKIDGLARPKKIVLKD